MPSTRPSDAASRTPLYRRISTDLAREIEKGAYLQRPLPTLRELCERYGVSVITVRQALSELERQGLVARQRGRSAVALPKARIKGKHPAVAMGLWHDHDPHEADCWAPLLLGANSVLQSAGRMSSVVDEGIGATDARSFARQLKERGYAGVLLRERFAVAWGCDTVLASLRREHIHHVLLDGRLDQSRHAYVCTDFVRAGWKAAGHLWALGHRNMLFCSPEPDVSLVDDRHEGFSGFLASVGARVADTWYKGPPKEAAAFIEQRPDVTAAFVIHDNYAREMLHEFCHHRGHRVPDELAVVSCDDSRYASMPQVQLTSIHQQFYQMGAIGAEILLSIMDGRQTEPMPHVLLQPHLVVRRSCGSGGS